MLQLTIDSEQKKAQFEILLKGEQEPMRFTVHKYEIVAGPSGHSFVVREATASREWMDLAMREFVLNKPFPLPEKYQKWIEMLI